MQSIDQSPADVINLSKLAKDGFNHTFLITLYDNFQMVTHIPYLATVPKYYAVASKVATMEFLHSSGLPIPQVYGYLPASDNMAKTKYIFMEFIRGMKLSDVWLELGLVTGWVNPHGLWVGCRWVQVWVGIPLPAPNPYPVCGYDRYRRGIGWFGDWSGSGGLDHNPK